MRHSSYETYLRAKALMDELRADLTNKIIEIFGVYNEKARAIQLCEIYSTEELQAAYHLLWEAQGVHYMKAMETAADVTKFIYQNSKQIAA